MPPGIESKILGGNNYQSDYTRQTEIFRNNILRTFVTPQSQAGNEKSNQNVAEYINDSAITGFIVNVANDQKWVLKYCNELLNRQLELMGISENLDIYFSYSRDDVLRYIMELSATAKENLYADYGTTADSNVAIVPPGIESKILGGNNYQSDYTRQTEIFRNNILRTFVTPQSQAGNERSNQNVAEYINDSAITGFIVNVANDQKWVLKYCNQLLNMQLELMDIDEALNVYFSYSRDDVLRYIMALSAEGDEIYKNYLSNFEEEQPVGERISSENGTEI